MQLLGETIGLQLELEGREQPVGRFSADLLCRDSLTGNYVLIENQLERTDHSHLGQLLTYAAALNAVTIVWIAARFTDEHRAALDWLNQCTDESIRFFGLEIELWRIGDSPWAPKFNIISKPNDWTREVQREAAQELTQTKRLQLDFWTAFRQHMEEHGSTVRCQKPAPVSWMAHALGRTGVRLNSIVSTWNWDTSTPEPEIRAEVLLEGPNSKRWFAELAAQRDAIEAALGFPLIWRNPENAVTCRAFVRLPADVNDPARWPEQFSWLRAKLEALSRVFSPLVRNLTAAEE